MSINFDILKNKLNLFIEWFILKVSSLKDLKIIDYLTKHFYEIDKKRLLPNLISSLSLFSGIIAVSYAFKEDFHSSLYFIILGMIFDAFDGRVARLMKSSNAEGVLIDSFVDFANYGVCTSLIFMSFFNFNIISMFISGIYLLNIMFRLVRFTANPYEEGFTFKGVSSPIAAVLFLFPLCLEIVFNVSSLNIITYAVLYIFISVYLFFVAFLPYSEVRILSSKDLILLLINIKQSKFLKIRLAFYSFISLVILLAFGSFLLFIYSLVFSYILFSFDFLKASNKF